MQKSSNTAVKEACLMSYLSLISEQTRSDFQSDLILVIIVKICLKDKSGVGIIVDKMKDCVVVNGV